MFDQDTPPGMKVAGVAQRTEPDDLPDENPFNGINIDHPIRSAHAALLGATLRPSRSVTGAEPLIWPAVT
jgi:hypothetical protein